MAVTPDQVRTIATEHASVEDARVQLFLDEAELRVNRVAWGAAKADRGVIYLTAHLLTLDAAQGKAAAGAVVAQSVGDVSVTYGQAAATDEDLSSTAWGRRFLSLRRTVFADRRV